MTVARLASPGSRHGFHASARAERVRGEGRHPRTGGSEVGLARIVAPRVVRRRGRKQVEAEARREIQQAVARDIVAVDGVAAGGQAENGDAGAPVIVNRVGADEIRRGVGRDGVDENAPMVAKNLVVGDLIR